MNPDRLIKATTCPKLGMQRRSSRSAIIVGVAILMLALSWTCIGATIGDFVWLDSNMDGIQDPNEVGLDNITVALYNQYGSLAASTQTANGGHYQFENIPYGYYFLRFFTFPFTEMDQGDNDELDSDVYPATCTTAIFELIQYTDLSRDAGIIIYLPGVVQPYADPVFRTPPPTNVPPNGNHNGNGSVVTSGPSNGSVVTSDPSMGIDVHLTYQLLLPDGTWTQYGAVRIASGHFEYGKPYAMPTPSTPGATVKGRPALPGEASVIFSEPTGGSPFPSVKSVVGSTDATVQITAIQWTYDGEPIGPVFTADPSLRGDPQGSQDPCESFTARIETDKSRYYVGENLIITFYVSEKAQVTLYDHLPNGKIQIMPLGTVEAGTHRLPGPGQSLTITEPVGVETVELRVTSESGCTASARTSFTVVPSGPSRPSWVESCTRQLGRASGVEYKAEGINYSIPRSQYMSFMVQELQIYETSVHPSVTAQMKQCAASLLNYLQQASSTEQSNIAQIFMDSYYQTRR